MFKPIRRVGVIGAGVMGSGIAAHLANARVEVVLLDMIPPNLSEEEKNDKNARNRFAAGGLTKALKVKPAAFFHKSFAQLIQIGNTEDDLGLLSDCDLIIEAVFERLDIKQKLFATLEKAAPKEAIIASNTSGLPIKDMLQNESEAFKKRFVVMHFFNPVRYMKLLEVVAAPETDPAILKRVQHFGEEVLGKGVVFAKDTPNFIGNRIGAYAMMLTVHQMLEDGLAPEDIDAITGLPMAHPKSASFRTADVVGFDTFVHVADNCHKALLQDEERQVFEVPSYIRTMIEKKLLGAKTKTRSGFYRKTKEGIETFDPATLEYRPKGGDEEIKKVCKKISKEEDPKERVRKLVSSGGKTEQFAWKILSRVLAYSARRVDEITESITSIDQAMRWGYNWELGPFEVWDALGFLPTLERMEKDGISIPESVLAMRESGAKSFYKDDGPVFELTRGEYVSQEQDPRTYGLEILRRKEAPVLSNFGAEAWDLGDGVLGLTFKTKSNSLDADSIQMLNDAAAKAEEEFQALIIYNQGKNFCVGANLFLVLMGADNEDWDQIREMVRAYQNATQRLKYAKVPVVAAPFEMTLGGGLELCFACDSVQAAAETYSGLVEVAVGLIPGGAGTLNMLWRALEGVPDGTEVNTLAYVTQVFKNIALAKVATSADEAKEFGYFRRTDGVSFDKARQLVETKNRALGLANSGYHPPRPRAYTLPGKSGIATLQMMVDTLVAGGFASAYDAKIARKLAEVLCGGAGGSSQNVTEEQILELEREAFLSLCGESLSQDRMRHMLMTNKPLRN